MLLVNYKNESTINAFQYYILAIYIANLSQDSKIGSSNGG